MKEILKKFSLLFLALTFGFAAGQRIDQKAKGILDRVSNNYKSKNNSYFKFVYGSGKGKVTKNETGIFYNAKDKYKLNIMGTEQIYDGKKVYSVSPSDKEVTIATMSDAETAFSPMSFVDQYKKGYNVQYVGRRSVNGVNADVVKLTPTTSTGIKEVNIFVNPANNQLVRIEQYSNDGNVGVITVVKYVENQKLSPNMFSFDRSKYQNYLITEL
ncbi:MAG: outer membrane lipoprotein carrier protein LolA [Chryseobacterium sp.]|nr:MAG: outer membrane lipoprotein carrier protein LolA [Chryseobacterium sp.]